MEISEDAYTVFTGEIESGPPPTIRVPDRELEIGGLEVGERYRIAILPPVGSEETVNAAPQGRRRSQDDPPVAAGESLEVEIEDMGEQGDGVAKIGPGYVIFVPETGIGDRVTIEITEARENFAFAEVVEPEPVSD